MQLKLTVRTHDDIVVVDCAGRIVFGEESADLRDTVKMVITQSKRIVLNLSDRKLTVRTHDDIVVVDCAGRIVFGEESADLRDTVKMVITQSKRIVLNL